MVFIKTFIFVRYLSKNYIYTTEILFPLSIEKVNFEILNTFWLNYKNMSNQDLLDASEKGKLKLLKNILSSKKVSINCKDILIQNHI